MKPDEHSMRLVAVGASVAANCQPCLQTSVAKAREEGITEADIASAIQIGKMVRRGATSMMDSFAQSLTGAVPISSSPEPGCSCQ